MKSSGVAFVDARENHGARSGRDEFEIGAGIQELIEQRAIRVSRDFEARARIFSRLIERDDGHQFGGIGVNISKEIVDVPDAFGESARRRIHPQRRPLRP